MIIPNIFGILEVLAKMIGQEKEMRPKNWKEIKLSLFANSIMGNLRDYQLKKYNKGKKFQ